MTASQHLQQIRNLPDSRKKAYKLLAVEGSPKIMQAAAREYARLLHKGFRP